MIPDAMAYVFHPDFRDFIQSLNDNEVDYVLLGGYAVILHGYARTTGDLDIWVRRTKVNFLKITKAFREFGMDRFEMTQHNFLNNDQIDVFTFGLPPICIDLMVDAKGLEFDETFHNAEIVEIDKVQVRLIHLSDLIRQKEIIGRAKDWDDINHLQP